MKLRTKYLLFVIIIHLVALVLSFFIFKENRIWFIVSELFILVSLLISWNLYKELISPLKLLLQGVDAINSRDFNVRFLPTGKYEMDELIDVYNQMIDQLRKERTRQEEQHFFLTKLIFTSPTGILILDHDEVINQVNPKALSFLSADEKELTGTNICDVSHPLLKQISQMKSGEAATVTTNGVSTYKVQKSHFIDRGFPRQFIMIEELTAEILAAEKKAYGKVIRMMAHEVNNTVGPVNSIIQSVLKAEEFSEGNSLSMMRNALQVAVDRNYNLNVFMRNFADVVRLPEPVRVKLDIHALIRNVAQLMDINAREKSIELVLQLAVAPFYIKADPQQMEQALINIIKNAIEAMDKAGIISIISYPEKYELKIIDHGPGIPGEIADQLFSPFFSTRKDGQGIGLTLVKEILLNHGYEFELKSFPDTGTVFRINFHSL